MCSIIVPCIYYIKVNCLNFNVMTQIIMFNLFTFSYWFVNCYRLDAEY